LCEQRYCSTFTGEEFFLADHRVSTNGHEGQELLPGVAYLEMARAAIEQTAPIQLESNILELRDTVWIEPMVVTEHKQAFIALFRDDNDQACYEIHSVEGEREVVHCQGQAFFTPRFSPARIDIERFKRQMGQTRLESSLVYAILRKMGLDYGNAHQGITSLYLGEKEILAQLHLPDLIETGQSDYVLHPSLMDSALQASIGLIIDLNHVPDKPYVPFALRSLRILSACTREMAAWVRYSEGSKPHDRAPQLDIDLCDDQGNVCVEMHGFTLRALNGELTPAHEKTICGAGGNGTNLMEGHSTFDTFFYQRLIAGVLNGELSVDAAVELA
jgi:acyl transferase domain-containing protein